MKKLPIENWSDFPALDLVRTGRLIRWAGRVTLVTLVACTVCMIFLPWRQTATGTGTVYALDPQERPQQVKSQTKGIVSYVKPGVREGSWVEAGEVVLELSPTAAGGVQQTDLQISAVELKIQMTRSRIEFAQQQVNLQENSGQFLGESLNQEIDAANKKWEQAQKEEAALRAELIDKQNQRRIAEEVAVQGIISREELISKRQAEDSHYQKVLKAENAEQEAYSNLRAKEEEAKSKLRDIEIKNRAAMNKLLEEQETLQVTLKERSDLAIKRQELDRLKVRAPRSGTIQQWYGLEGSDTVKEGEQLFVIVPKSNELAVEMSLSGNDMPLVHVGDRVRLQFEGWPAVQFVGWPSVAVGTFGGKVNRIFPSDDGKGNFRVVVIPDNHFIREDGWPNDNYLRQGVRANGWVLLSRVPLGYEIWRQLNGFPASVTSNSNRQMDAKGAKVNLPKT